MHCVKNSLCLLLVFFCSFHRYSISRASGKCKFILSLGYRNVSRPVVRRKQLPVKMRSGSHRLSDVVYTFFECTISILRQSTNWYVMKPCIGIERDEQQPHRRKTVYIFL